MTSPSAPRRPPSYLSAVFRVFDVVVGSPDAAPLHVVLAPVDAPCPDWLFDELRARLATEPGASEAEGRLSYVAHDDEGRRVSSDGTTCCWDVTRTTARAWI